MFKHLKTRWFEESGYYAVLKIAAPLILSTASWSLQSFIDRMFLAWHSPEALAASLPASMLSLSVVSLFFGTSAYVSTFVAQYYGARQWQRIGAVAWQGIYLAIFILPVALLFYLSANSIFTFFKHEAALYQLETCYFKISLIGAPFIVISNAISGLFSGLGRTWTVMWINCVGTLINIIADYLLIFGKLGLPTLGIRGAGWATNLSIISAAALFFFMMIRLNKTHNFGILSHWHFDRTLFLRLLRYGLPSGIQFSLELFAFAAFTSLVGSLGVVALAASNIAFNINMLAFLPMHGLSIAVSVLVGQYLGENRAHLAEKVTWSAFHLALTFFTILGISYFLTPDIYIWPFELQASPGSGPISLLTAILLRFVAFYCLFDAGNMIFSGALKGAGDTRFVALASIASSWLFMLLPSWFALHFIEDSLYWLWGFLTFYICVLCFTYWGRFIRGTWKQMRVIEHSASQNYPA